MKRKIYFIISSIMQMIIAIYSIFTANKIVEGILNDMAELPTGMQEKFSAIYQNSGERYIIVLSCISLLLGVLIIVWACQNKLLKKREKVMACSIASFFTAMNSTATLLAIVNFCVIASAKRTRPEDYPDKKEKLPKLEKEKIDNKKITLAILLFVAYFSHFWWDRFIPEGKVLHMLVGAIFYVTMIILSLIVFFDLYKSNYPVFIKKFKAYYQNLIGDIGKLYLVYFGGAIISAFVAKSITSVNQNNIMALPLWYSFPLAVIYAPIVEEALFRGCIRRFIKNDKVFIIVSAISFGLLHTLFTEANIVEAIVLGLPYMALGGGMAYLYTKTNNIFTNMSFHAFHNTVAMIFSVLIGNI